MKLIHVNINTHDRVAGLGREVNDGGAIVDYWHWPSSKSEKIKIQEIYFKKESLARTYKDKWILFYE